MPAETELTIPVQMPEKNPTMPVQRAIEERADIGPGVDEER
jgi:hypothetical protein